MQRDIRIVITLQRVVTARAGRGGVQRISNILFLDAGAGLAGVLSENSLSNTLSYQ